MNLSKPLHPNTYLQGTSGSALSTGASGAFCCRRRSFLEREAKHEAKQASSHAKTRVAWLSGVAVCVDLDLQQNLQLLDSLH